MEIKLEDFEQYLRVKNLSKRTIKEYSIYFDKLVTTQAFFTQDGFVKFLDEHNNPVARAFLNNLLGYIRSSSQIPVIIKQRASLIILPKVSGRARKRIPDVLSLQEVNLLADSFREPRNRFMTLISFQGGIRLEELINILPYDFNWNTWLSDPQDFGNLKIKGKGDKERVVFIFPETMRDIYQWIINIASKKQGRDKPLFVIGMRRWQYILEAQSLKILGRRINPHLLRHSCGTWLTEKGLSDKEIADYLGHESVVTTQRYTHIKSGRLKNKYKEVANSESSN